MINPFNLAWGKTIADTSDTEPVQDTPATTKKPEFKVETKVELSGHGGFKVRAALYRRTSTDGYVFINGFEQDTTEEGIPETKIDVNLRANRYVDKLRVAEQDQEVRYID